MTRVGRMNTDFFSLREKIRMLVIVRLRYCRNGNEFTPSILWTKSNFLQSRKIRVNPSNPCHPCAKVAYLMKFLIQKNKTIGSAKKSTKKQ